MIIDYAYKMALKWDTKTSDIIKATEFLKKFEYLKKDDSAVDIALEDIMNAVKLFQELAGLLNIDGEVGPKTLRAMTQPRCGCPDAFTSEAREYIRKWAKKELSYYIKNRDKDLPTNTWDDIIEQSFDAWASISLLKFYRVNRSSSANFIIDVGSGSRSNFDGPGRTLAWAYLPPRNNYNGQLLMKFDTAETWVDLNSTRGIRLLNVATHEVGHLLGLEHSKIKTALMAPYYNRNIIKPQNNDDVKRIVALYGKNTENPNPKPDEPENNNKTSITLHGKIDNIEIPGYRVTKFS